MTGSIQLEYGELQARHELDVYGKRGITLVRGSGAKVWDDEDREYIDCVGGYGAAGLGHCHARILEALDRQARKLISCPGFFSNDTKALYLERLVDAAPSGLTRAFLCNSGTEAVEAAMKFARISTGRQGIIAAMGGFHGRTFGAMSATFRRDYSRGCEPLLPGITHVPFNDRSALEHAMKSEPAALILEVIQGEGGVIPGDPLYLQAARRLCDLHGALLVIDEVQTGFCRTGKMFASEHSGLHPHILCLAKSIAAGIPMGAVLVDESVKVPRGRHGSTFGGNPLACAAALEALDVMTEDDLASRASRKGDRFVHRLLRNKPASIREIRHMGLMIGIELKCHVKPVLKALMEEGVLALSAGSTVLRLLPPLVIEEKDLDRAGGTIAGVIENI
ncbi:MAG: aspartate aminotransferase family protein [Planctomycetota bacterium]|jgi:acetylornithine/LysW-gamma-L-lysine aminotransferase